MESTTEELVSFSEGALKELFRSFMSEKEKIKNSPTADSATIPTLGLRLGVVGGGCAGMSYTLGFDQPADRDLIEHISFPATAADQAVSMPVYINKAHSLYLAGMRVDYEEGLKARGFTFSNPNASSTCGCGSSFGV